MHRVDKSVLIEHSAEKMFLLVDDVESYPQFLPWCSATAVGFRDATESIATLQITYLGIKAKFTTNNKKNFPLSMTIQLVDGPFKELNGLWAFKALSDNACKIDFQLSYRLSNIVFEKVIGPVFSQINNTLVDAFVKRADDIYK